MKCVCVSIYELLFPTVSGVWVTIYELLLLARLGYVYTNLWTSISVYGWAMCIHLWSPFPSCDWDMFCEFIYELLFLAVAGVYVSIYELLFLAMAGVCFVYPFMNSYSWLWLRYVMCIHFWTPFPGCGWGM